MEVVGSTEVAHDATIDFGRGQNTKLGWSDPTSLPRKPWRSLQPGEQGKALFPMCFARVESGPRERRKEGELMSIINKPPEMVKREYELQEPIAVAVEKYAAFIASTPDHVVNSALKMVLWRDADFRRWRKQQQTPNEKKDGHAAAKAAHA
jgi:hypothetical protein